MLTNLMILNQIRIKKQMIYTINNYKIVLNLHHNRDLIVEYLNIVNLGSVVRILFVKTKK